MNLPPFAEFPEIISDRLVLRQIQHDDLEDILEISFYNAKPALTIADAAEMQRKINLDYENGSSIHWGIANKENNEIAGTVGFYRGFKNGTGELGCVLRPEFQSRGLMTEAMKLAIAFGQNEMELLNIIAVTTPENIKAIKLLERLNFKKIKNPPDGKIEFELKNNLK